MVQDFYTYTKFLEPKLWVVSTLWKVHKYTFFSGPYFRIWTEYEDLLLKSPYSVRIRENTDQKNSVFAHFSHSIRLCQRKPPLFFDVWLGSK